MDDRSQLWHSFHEPHEQTVEIVLWMFKTNVGIFLDVEEFGTLQNIAFYIYYLYLYKIV